MSISPRGPKSGNKEFGRLPCSKYYNILKGRFRSVNQGLNDKGRCCEVRAQTSPKIPTLAAVDSLLMRCASVTSSKNKKLLKIRFAQKLM